MTDSEIYALIERLRDADVWFAQTYDGTEREDRAPIDAACALEGLLYDINRIQETASRHA